MKYAMLLDFNGAQFHGWQIQPNGCTVQETLEKGLSMLCKQQIEVVGNGRTDAGVHAKNYVAHFVVNQPIVDLMKFLFQLNGILPKTIAVKSVVKVSEDFHARFSAIQRTYKYFVTKHKDPFLDDRALFYPYDLDVPLMNKTALQLFGTHDFTSFTKVNSDSLTQICTIYKADWTEEERVLVFTITANRFLRNMIRALVGTLLLVGRKQLTPMDFDKIILAKDRSCAGSSVAAKGLFFYAVRYPESTMNP